MLRTSFGDEGKIRENVQKASQLDVCRVKWKLGLMLGMIIDSWMTMMHRQWSHLIDSVALYCCRGFDVQEVGSPPDHECWARPGRWSCDELVVSHALSTGA